MGPEQNPLNRHARQHAQREVTSEVGAVRLRRLPRAQRRPPLRFAHVRRASDLRGRRPAIGGYQYGQAWLSFRRVVRALSRRCRRRRVSATARVATAANIGLLSRRINSRITTSHGIGSHNTSSVRPNIRTAPRLKRAEGTRRTQKPPQGVPCSTSPETPNCSGRPLRGAELRQQPRSTEAQEHGRARRRCCCSRPVPASRRDRRAHHWLKIHASSPSPDKSDAERIASTNAHAARLRRQRVGRRPRGGHQRQGGHLPSRSGASASPSGPAAGDAGFCLPRSICRPFLRHGESATKDSLRVKGPIVKSPTSRRAITRSHDVAHRTPAPITSGKPYTIAAGRGVASLRVNMP